MSIYCSVIVRQCCAGMLPINHVIFMYFKFIMNIRIFVFWDVCISIFMIKYSSAILRQGWVGMLPIKSYSCISSFIVNIWIFVFCHVCITIFMIKYCNAILRQGWAGMVPIISVSRGHFTSTDIVLASRDLDLVKNTPNTKYKIDLYSLSLLANRSRVGLSKIQHGKLFPNWSLDCYQKIDPPSEVGVGQRGHQRKTPKKSFKF